MAITLGVFLGGGPYPSKDCCGKEPRIEISQAPPRAGTIRNEDLIMDADDLTG